MLVSETSDSWPRAAPVLSRPRLGAAWARHPTSMFHEVRELEVWKFRLWDFEFRSVEVRSLKFWVLR